MCLFVCLFVCFVCLFCLFVLFVVSDVFVVIEQAEVVSQLSVKEDDGPKINPTATI
jgi:hypothetical protein